MTQSTSELKIELINPPFKAGDKVRIKNKAQILHITGDFLLDGGVIYFHVKERSYAIKQSDLELVNK
jgi:16S rRNA G1207 methylase RsmC